MPEADTAAAAPGQTGVAPVPPHRRWRAMRRGLQRRLLVLLLLPLVLLAASSAWLDYRSADSAALQQDAQLLRMVPLMADSIVVPDHARAMPTLLLAPPVEEFLRERHGTAAYSVTSEDGRLLYGEDWIDAMRPGTREPEFFSREHDGVVYRIVAQRVQTPAGELVMQLADGSDPRQQWGRSLLLRALLPNLVLLALAALAMHLAVQHALRPLTALTEAVQHRSPRDLSPLDARASPEEVRPLVLALNRLFGLVNAQSESQRRFVADAAHQLRTPLAGLQAQVEAWAQAAIRQESAPKVPAAGAQSRHGAMFLEASDVYKLRDATRRTSQLAHQLLALSRADAHALQGQEPAPVDLKALCESMLETHLDAATARGIDLGLEVQPAQTLGHAWLLREMLGNLVDNAVKYAHAYGTVTIRCGPAHGGGARLEVEDDGPGVAPDERLRVLSRFYRSPGAQGQGSGLGLAIADEIARLHGGRLRLLAGAEGVGLRVEVVLPAEPPAAGALPPTATSP